MHYFYYVSPISKKEHKKGTSYTLQKRRLRQLRQLLPMKNKNLQSSHTFPCPKKKKKFYFLLMQSKCLIFRFNIYLKENAWLESHSYYMTKIKYPGCHYCAVLLRSQSWSFFPCCHLSLLQQRLVTIISIIHKKFGSNQLKKCLFYLCSSINSV